jgi:hypothetical protein
MLTDSQFPKFYAQAKSILEKYRQKKEVEAFLLTKFAEVEKTKSLLALKDELSWFCKHSQKVSSVGLTAFGGTCTTSGCLKKLKAITQEISSILKPSNAVNLNRKRSEL